MKKIVISVIIFLGGCANPGIVPLSPDTYMLFKEDHAGIFGSMAKLKADVIGEANKFAMKQDKIAIPISVHEKPIGTNRPGDWASFEYQFRVVDKNDSEARRTSLTPRADIVIEKTENVSADIYTKDQSEKTKDVYAELIKLDDLRKKGIISNTEFESQKMKILGGN